MLQSMLKSCSDSRISVFAKLTFVVALYLSAIYTQYVMTYRMEMLYSFRNYGQKQAELSKVNGLESDLIRVPPALIIDKRLVFKNKSLRGSPKLPPVMKADIYYHNKDKEPQHYLNSRNTSNSKRNGTSQTSINEFKSFKRTHFLLTLCTVIKNDVAYIVEWIEYMRLQGVDRFVIYDDGSTDEIFLLKNLYARVDPEFELHVLQGETMPNSTTKLPRFLKDLRHCIDNFGNTTEWMIVSDTDEFFFSPAYGTLGNMLGNISAIEKSFIKKTKLPKLSSIYADCTRYGTSGQQRRFQYHLAFQNGTVSYLNGCGTQLILDHTRRAPDPRVQEFEEQPLFHELIANISYCRSKASHPDLACHHSFGKSLFRPQDVLVPGVHFPEVLAPGATEAKEFTGDHSARKRAALFSAPRNLAWCNHYYMRSREDVDKKAREFSSKWPPGEFKRFFEGTDEAFYGHIEDPSLQRRWRSELQDRVRRFVTQEGACESQAPTRQTLRTGVPGIVAPVGSSLYTVQ